MKIVVAGGTGLVGSALVREFQSIGYEVISASTKNVDFLNRSATNDFIFDAAPEVVIDAAARVGGIGANNSFPVEFFINNVNIQNNLMEASYIAKVKKFIFLGSSCIYPKRARVESMHALYAFGDAQNFIQEHAHRESVPLAPKFYADIWDEYYTFGNHQNLEETIGLFHVLDSTFKNCLIIHSEYSPTFILPPKSDKLKSLISSIFWM